MSFMTENKLVPKLRFGEFKSEWDMKFGNEVFQSISNKNHDSDLPVLAISQEFGAIPRHMINYKISVTVKSITSYKIVEVGDFIISLRSFQGGIEYSNYRGICSPAYNILRPHIPIQDNFYKFYLKTFRYIQNLKSKLEGIRDGKMISFKYFSEIKLPYPSLSEQKKIASFLSSVDDKIQKLNRKKELLQEYKKGVMQKIFSKELRFKDDNGNDYPDWEEKKLGLISNISIGEFVIKTKQNANSLYPVFNGGKSYTGFYDQFNNEGPKIIISARGANAGFVNFYKNKYWAGNSCYSIDMLDECVHNINYIYYYIKFKESSLIDNQQAANIPSVSKREMQSFNIIYPIFKEQNKIANFLSSIDKKIDLISNQLENTKVFKKGLLQQMFV